MAKKLTGTNGRYKPDMFQGFHDPIALNQSAERVSNELNISRQALNRLLDPRRDIDKECGYPPTSSLTPQNYRDLYDREPIATRCVDLMAKESWQVQPLIYETEDEEDVTDFEQAMDDIEVGLSGNSWHQNTEGGTLIEYMFRADRMSGIGHFSVILLGIDDGLDLQDAVDGVVALDETVNPTGSIQQPNASDTSVTREKASGPQTGKEPTGNQRSFVRNLLVRNVAAPRGMRDCYMTEDEEKAILNAAPQQKWSGGWDSDGKPRMADYVPAPLTNEEKDVVESWRRERVAIEDRARTLNTTPKTLITNWGRYVAEQPTTNAPFVEGTDAQYSTGERNQPTYPTPNGTDQQYFGVQFGPSQEFKTPSGNKRKLVFMRVFDESLVQIVRYEWNVRNPRFGQPVMYRITLNDPRETHSGVGLPMATVFVHWSRVVHVPADNRGSSEVFGVPELRPVLNPILDIRKGRGASAEGLWQAAFSTLSFETHPQLGGDVDVDVGSLKDQYEQNINGLQRAYMTKGMVIKTISPTVTDPTPYIEVQIESICIQKGCPIRVFKGSERGELASSQDDSSWNDRLHHRQVTRNTPVVVCAVLDRLILLGILPEPGKKGKQKLAINRITRIYKVLVPIADAPHYWDRYGRPQPISVWNVPLTKPTPKPPGLVTKTDDGGSTDEEDAGATEPPDTGESDSAGGTDGAEADAGGGAASGGAPPGSGAGKPGAPQATPGMIEKSIAIDSTKIDLPTGYTVEWPDLDSVSDKDKAAILAQRATAYSTYVQGNLEALIPPKSFMVHFDNMTEKEADAILGEAQAAAEQAMTMPAPGERGHPTTELDEPIPPPASPFGGPPGATPPDGEDTGDMGAVGGEGWPDEEPADEEPTQNVDDSQHMDGDMYTRLRQTCKNLIQQVEAEVGAPLEDEDKADLIDDFLTELGLRDIDAADMVANCGGEGGTMGPCPTRGAEIDYQSDDPYTGIITPDGKFVKVGADEDEGVRETHAELIDELGFDNPSDGPLIEDISAAIGKHGLGRVIYEKGESALHIDARQDKVPAMRRWVKKNVFPSHVETVSYGHYDEKGKLLKTTSETMSRNAVHVDNCGGAGSGIPGPCPKVGTKTVTTITKVTKTTIVKAAKTAKKKAVERVKAKSNKKAGAKSKDKSKDKEKAPAKKEKAEKPKEGKKDEEKPKEEQLKPPAAPSDKQAPSGGGAQESKSAEGVASALGSAVMSAVGTRASEAVAAAKDEAKGWLKGSAAGELAERISLAKGSTPAEASALRGTLATLDQHSKSIGAKVKGEGSKLAGLPTATIGYLAYSSIRHPIATAKAALGLVKDKVVGAAKSAIGLKTNTLTTNELEDDAQKIADAYEEHDYDDWYIAIFHGCLAAGLETDEAVDLANDIYDERGDDPVANGYDADKFLIDNCGGEGGTMGPCPDLGSGIAAAGVEAATGVSASITQKVIDTATDAVAKSVGARITTGLQSALSGLDDESLGGISRIVQGVKGVNPLAIAQGAGGIASTIYKCVHQEMFETALSAGSGIPGAAIVAKIAATGLAHAETAVIKGVKLAGSAILKGIAKAVGKLAGSFGGGYQGMPQPAMVGNVSYADLSKTDKVLVDIMTTQVADALKYVYGIAGIDYSVDEDDLRERVILMAVGG